ncbi:MAG: hypothetical protein ACR2O0_09185 [Rhizobiaceae bacterium]
MNRYPVIFAALLGFTLVWPGVGMAFEEVPVPRSPQTGSVQEPNSKNRDKEAVSPQTNLTEESKSGGLKIPGFGSIKLLPNLNFGLEVLYGADSHNKVEESISPDTTADDLAIKGRLKRRF